MLDGKKESIKIFKNLKTAKNKSLAVVLVGQNKASNTYVRIKEKKAKQLNVNFKKIHFSSTVSQIKIIETIEKLNKDKKITGILVQLPLPKKFNTNKILQSININKDVDGLLFNKGSKYTPPTIQSILHLIKLARKPLKNKKATILCNSNEFATSLKTVLAGNKIKSDIKLKPKSNTKLSKYDIIVVALGKKHFLKPNMVKKDCIIIDVGINKVGNKIYGDVHPDCQNKTKLLSPVPGGVGPLTVAYLYKNLLK